MSLADELFGPETAVPPPPEAKRWEQFILQGTQPVCTFVRRREGLGWAPALIVISYPNVNSSMPPEPPIPWEPRLERWLLDHKVRAVDEENEAERFGYGLEDQFEPIERRCGSGYFNSVLGSYVRDSGFAEHASVREKLAAIHADPPSETPATVDCRARIKSVLGTTARSLKSLGYAQDKAIEILANAIAYYLDDRFNLHTRAVLGLG